MKKLYIFDLEGTTGIYSERIQHVNDVIKLRPGFRETLDFLHATDTAYCIATRAPEGFVSEIVRNLRARGVDIQGKVYTQEDITLKDDGLLYYKDYAAVYRDHNLKDPAAEAIVVGDFLRFSEGSCYSTPEYANFDFAAHPRVLSENNALNDHPYPYVGQSPVYVVVPQPWTTKDSRGVEVSLDMTYVYHFVEAMYVIGDRNFARGFDLLQSTVHDQCIKDSGLARRCFGQDTMQRYAVIKGSRSAWKPLERLM